MAKKRSFLCPWCLGELYLNFTDDESFGQFKCDNPECIACRKDYTIEITARGRIFNVEKEIDTPEGVDRIHIPWPKIKKNRKASMKGALDRFIISEELGQNGGECH